MALGGTNKKFMLAIFFSIVVVACGGGSSGSTSSAGSSGTHPLGVSVPNPTPGGGAPAPAIAVVGTQLGGARQGVVPTLAGIVSNYAGAGVIGSADGTGIYAGFNTPHGIATDGLNLYVADELNGVIRKVDLATGAVTTMSTGITTFGKAVAITTDGTNLFVVISWNTTSVVIQKIVLATGTATTMAGQINFAGNLDGIGANAMFSGMAGGITTDGTYLYYCDTGNHSIRKILIANAAVSTIAGTLVPGGTTLAGNTWYRGVPGNADNANGMLASFNLPQGITTDGTNLYIADTGNNAIRKIVIATGAVTTLAGSALAMMGSADGIGTAASFTQPVGITTDGTNLYVADTANHTIRKIAMATSAVTTLAGSPLSSGNVNATGSAARFNNPSAITTDGKILYIADTNNQEIRKVQ